MKRMNKKILMLKIIMLIILFILFEIVSAKENIAKPENCRTIDSHVFSRSIQSQMFVGDSYTVIIPVKNCGQSRATFLVIFTAPREFFYPPYNAEKIELDSGEFYKIKIPLTPIKEHIGPLNITSEVYLLKSTSNSGFGLQDRASKSVNVIKRAFSTKDIAAVVILSTIMISGFAIIVKKSKFSLK